MYVFDILEGIQEVMEFFFAVGVKGSVCFGDGFFYILFLEEI